MEEVLNGINEVNKELREEYPETETEDAPIFEFDANDYESTRKAFVELTKYIPFYRTRKTYWYPLNPESELVFKVGGEETESEWMDNLDK